MTTQDGDPFTLFRIVQNLAAEKGGRVFASGEHMWLGQAGAIAACSELGYSTVPFTRVKRVKSGDVFTYGELVALSGDFYGSPEELLDETPTKLPWLPTQGNDIAKLRRIFHKELAAIEKQRCGEAVGYPNENITLALAAKSYVELAVDNNDHFGWHNMKAYLSYHSRALDLAISSRTASHKSNALWQRAIFMNAFADHFLTDAFAAGHVRIPRAQIRTLGKTRKGWSDKLAGILAMLLHNQDGHIDSLHNEGEFERPAEDGLFVKNSHDVEWHTRCDGQLFIVRDNVSEPLIREPVSAVKKSVAELIEAKTSGTRPTGPFAACMHVPYPHSAGTPLTEKFPVTMAEQRIDALWRSMSWFAKVPWIGPGLKRHHIPELFELLPALMAQFRRDIAEDLKATPELSQQLPTQYIMGFRSVA